MISKEILIADQLYSVSLLLQRCTVHELTCKTDFMTTLSTIIKVLLKEEMITAMFAMRCVFLISFLRKQNMQALPV